MAKRKDEVLLRISSNASKFDTSYDKSFVCPACLRLTPLKSASKISEAHILPRSAGGSLKTYLCGTCNSYFGSNQDAWFGEYLYLLGSGKGLFATRKQPRTFTINGVKVTGEFKESNDGALEVYTYKDLMSPDAVLALEEAHQSGRLEISAKIPVVANEQKIKIGFLTAGYLLWFKELGYSWVFQGHLQKVREQILNPERRIIPGTYLSDVGEEVFENPWIGFVELGQDSYPCAGIADRIVLFPSFSGTCIYEKLAGGSVREMKVQYEAVRISKYHQFPDPTAIGYRDQVLVFPDHFVSGSVRAKLMLYAGDGQPPKVLYQMGGEIDEQAGEVNVVKMRRADA